MGELLLHERVAHDGACWALARYFNESQFPKDPCETKAELCRREVPLTIDRVGFNRWCAGSLGVGEGATEERTEESTTAVCAGNGEADQGPHRCLIDSGTLTRTCQAGVETTRAECAPGNGFVVQVSQNTGRWASDDALVEESPALGR